MGKPPPAYETVKLSVSPQRYAVVELARSRRYNAFNEQMWLDFKAAFEWLNTCSDVQAVVVVANGKNFCAGIDLATFSSLREIMAKGDVARSAIALKQHILDTQESFNAIERCRWPVIAAVHGACIGAGVDLIAACDIRLCSQDATFCVKEVDVGLAADVGTLQRLPPIIGHGATMDLALTARSVDSNEAKALHLVSEVLPHVEALHEKVFAIAADLANKSPVALTGTKHVLLHSRDHSIRDSLEYVATWNSSQLMTDDTQEIVAAKKASRRPAFSKL